jgi:hypothetical protein
MTRRQTKQESASVAPETSKAKATRPPRKPAPFKWHIHTVPEMEGEESEFVGSLPADDDPDSYIEESAHVAPGQACKVVKGDGRGKVVTSYRYRKLGDGGRGASLSLDDEEDEGGAMPAAPVVSLDAVARAAAQETARLLGRERTQASVETNLLDDFETRLERHEQRRKREREELREEMRAEYERLNAGKRDGGQVVSGDGESVLMGAVAKLAENDPELAAKVVERVFPSKDEGWGSIIAGAAKEHPQIAQQVIVGGLATVSSLIGSIFKRAPATDTGQAAAASTTTQTAPDATVAPDASPQGEHPAQTALRIVVEDLRRNRRPGRAADAIEDAIRAAPELGTTLRGMLARPENEIVRELSNFAQEDLSLYAHAEGFITDLKEELTPDDEEDEGGEAESDVQTAATVGSNNGAQAHAGASVK